MRIQEKVKVFVTRTEQFLLKPEGKKSSRIQVLFNRICNRSVVTVETYSLMHWLVIKTALVFVYTLK